jgi:hypothetical protein
MATAAANASSGEGGGGGGGAPLPATRELPPGPTRGLVRHQRYVGAIQPPRSTAIANMHTVARAEQVRRSRRGLPGLGVGHIVASDGRPPTPYQSY